MKKLILIFVLTVLLSGCKLASITIDFGDGMLDYTEDEIETEEIE